jgi:hypothetical protein
MGEQKKKNEEERIECGQWGGKPMGRYVGKVRGKDANERQTCGEYTVA